MGMEIIRGTTPTLNFVLPFEVASIAELKLTFMQNGEVVFTKGLGDVVLEDLALAVENSLIIDNNHGDSIDSNNSDFEEEEEIIQTYSNCSIHLSQEDTLAFKFWPAAEKNIAYSQIRILDTSGEAYASDPLNFRIYGVLLDGQIGTGGNNE